MGIGKRLKDARLNRGLTQNDLAEKVGVTPSAIVNYEKETSHPKEPILYALMNALRVDANYLFQDCVDIKKAPIIDERLLIASEGNPKLLDLISRYISLSEEKQKDLLQYGKILVEMEKHQPKDD